MSVTTGHHGRPPDFIQDINNFRQQDKEAAFDFLKEIKPLFPAVNIPEFWDEDDSIELFNHLSWFISAAVVLADWVGSSTRYFPRMASKMGIREYWQQHAQINAVKAISAFPPISEVSPFSGVAHLFPFIHHPTPLQQQALQLEINKEGAQLFILEDVTGAGKTEAALILAHRLMAAGKAKGIYFGLPTMATANAMLCSPRQRG